MKRIDAIKAVCAAIDKNDAMSNREKRWMKATIRFRPAIRAEVVGMVIADAHVEGLVDENGEAEAAFDFIALIALAELLLPLIRQWIENRS